MSTQPWASVRSGRDPQFTTQFDTLVRAAFRPVAVRTGPGVRSVASGRFVPAAETVRDGDDALVRLDLPGVEVSADVTVEVDGDRLVVSGERKDLREQSERGRGLQEVRYGTFRRVFSLPASVTADVVSATYDAGVLTVRVAGAHVAGRARRIEVTTAAPVAVTTTAETTTDGAPTAEAPTEGSGAVETTSTE